MFKNVILQKCASWKRGMLYMVVHEEGNPFWACQAARDLMMMVAFSLYI